MKSSHRQSLGRKGESIVVSFLEGKNYTIVERNARTPYGEIDIIARQGCAVVFVEVKSRASRSFGPPEISITPKKLEHMRSAAEYYIQVHPDMATDWRIDVITVLVQPGGSAPQIDHFENVIY
jgi:putative endonuclease